MDTNNAKALEMANQFGVGIVVAGEGPEGSLRRAAMVAGIPAIIYEADPPNTSPAQRLASSRWLRVPKRQGGIFLPTVGVGDVVTTGQLVATVTDPITDQVHEIRANEDGVVIGMSLPRVVLSGSALIHVGRVE